jgi:hypothetical protein
VRYPEWREPGGDLDFADENASAFNRAAAGLLDVPVEVELTAAMVLVITAAESVVERAELRWLGLA